MMGAPVADRAALYEGLGIAPDVARAMAEGAGPDMGRCILALYRSAPEAELRQAGERLGEAAARPGLAIVATEDHYVGTQDMARACAERVGAEIAVLEGLGHWWMTQDPARGAQALRAFWRDL
jgi:pimeloyl-ACP methyl ester carboxylesterase